MIIKKRHSITNHAFLLLFVISVFIPVVSVFVSSSASAIVQECGDPEFYSSNTVQFYDPCESPCATSSASASAVGASGTASLPEATLKQLEDGKWKEKAEANRAAYEAGEKASGIPWTVIATIHYREASMDPKSSIANGEPITGSKYLSIDGQPIGATLAEDAEIAAKKFANIAKSVYQIQLSADSSIEDWAHGFLAYNRGNMYKMANEPFDKSPYVMNGYDESHLDMKWIHADSWAGPKKLNDLEGKTENRPGALAMLAFLGGPSGSISSGACTCGPATSAPSATVLTGKNDAEKAFNYLVSQGFTKQGAAGMIGSLMIETGGGTYNFNPKAVNSSGHSGIVQWDKSDRWPKMVAFAKQKKMDPKTLEAQLAFIPHEMKTRYEAVYKVVTTTNSVSEAAGIVADKYEIGGGKSIRTEYAKQAFKDFSGNPTSPPSTSEANCDGDVTTIDGLAFPLIVKKSDVSEDNVKTHAGHPYLAHDIIVKSGTQVVAMRPGVVTAITQDRCPGRFISIYDKSSNRTTSYLHLAMNQLVKKGDTVVAGQKIGVVGAARPNGCGTAHLHIDEVKGNSRPSCSRLNCPKANQRYFVDIIPILHKLWQALPEQGGPSTL